MPKEKDSPQCPDFKKIRDFWIQLEANQPPENSQAKFMSVLNYWKEKDLVQNGKQPPTNPSS